MESQQNDRKSSYGEGKLSLVDHLGVYLSKREIMRHIQHGKSLNVLDIGCGYNASILTMLLPYCMEGTGIDLSISEQAKSIKEPSFVEGNIEDILPQMLPQKFDLILMISVLEHLRTPQQILVYCNRLLKSGGILLINVPTWRGKFFLEFSAFKLGTSPACEMDDHKMYYDKQNLWPLLVEAGFKPSQIHLGYIKFGLNLFARIYKS